MHQYNVHTKQKPFLPHSTSQHENAKAISPQYLKRSKRLLCASNQLHPTLYSSKSFNGTSFTIRLLRLALYRQHCVHSLCASQLSSLNNPSTPASQHLAAKLAELLGQRISDVLQLRTIGISNISDHIAVTLFDGKVTPIIGPYTVVFPGRRVRWLKCFTITSK